MVPEGESTASSGPSKRETGKDCLRFHPWGRNLSRGFFIEVVRMKWDSAWIRRGSLALLCGVAYSSALWGAFVWDDRNFFMAPPFTNVR